MKCFAPALPLRFLLFALTGLLGCQAPAPHTVARTRVLMDTAITLKIFLSDQKDEQLATACIDSAFIALTRLDSSLSSYRQDSEIASVNRNTQPARVSATLDSLLRMAQEVSRNTGGAFDITIAPVLRLWGFGTDTLDVPTDAEITSRLPLVNFRHLKLRQESAPHALTSLPTNTSFMSFEQPGMAIDLGGIAKGYAADVAARIFSQHGFQDYLIAAGGDLHMAATTLTAGQRHIWIKHPRKSEQFFARFRLDRGAVSTSGDYERYFEREGKRYHHILDPITGYPAGFNRTGAQLVSVTVVANRTIYSDAFATAFFVMGLERGLTLAEQLPELEAVFVFIGEGKLQWRATSGLKDELEIIETEF